MKLRGYATDPTVRVPRRVRDWVKDMIADEKIDMVYSGVWMVYRDRDEIGGYRLLVCRIEAVAE